MSPKEKLELLIAKLEQLQQAHQHTGIEIVRLRGEVNSLKNELGYSAPLSDQKRQAFEEVPVSRSPIEEVPEIKIDFEKTKKSSLPPPLPQRSRNNPSSIEALPKKPAKPFNIEAFIGGNLINKIGILILIIGLGLFVKYAIDNGYFPPIVRLILSFLAGLTLVGIGYRLKSKYKTYSAVLFSGGIAVLYFSAYAGNAFYDPILLPRTTAFILMVVFTIVTVLAATIYNLEIIALLGLVGAYAVPLLLSDDSGNYELFLSYIAIINTGILLVSIKKDWRLTLYIAFGLTWLILSYWIVLEDYKPGSKLDTAWLFNCLFFVLFYVALVIYNLLKNKEISIDSILFIILNAFIFFGLGMLLLENNGMDNYQGLFAISNGGIHLITSIALYERLSDKKLFFAISGLFWVFVTIAIGIEFDANISAILWLGEAAILFGIGRRFKIDFYEIASLLVLLLGLTFLVENWLAGYYNSEIHHSILFNTYFLSSVLALVILSVMMWMHQKWKVEFELGKVMNLLLPILFVGVIYASFFNEIYHQFEQAFLNSELENVMDWDIIRFRTIWLINYSFLFCILLILFNQYYLKDKLFAGFIGLLTSFVLLAFLFSGILTLNELRVEYLNQELNPLFQKTSYWIWIRYIMYAFVGATLFGIYKLLNWLKDIERLDVVFQLVVYLVILVVLSSELTTLMTVGLGYDETSLVHKVGFSILWAIYSLIMIIVGFRKRSKVIRIAGMTLFGITLVKVFFLDLVDISTESRILLFVAIGILLLVTSYFYQRYRNIFLGDEENEDEIA